MERKIDKDPFSNGTEHMMWEERNCDKCWKSSHIKSGSDTEYTPVRCSIQRDIFIRMGSNEPINQRTIDACSQLDCPYRQETRKRKKRDRNAKEPKLFEL